MSRMCPFCQRAPREGEDMSRARVAEADFTPEVLAKLKREHPPQPGLYGCCVDCVALVTPGICARVNADHGTSFTPATLPGNFLV